MDEFARHRAVISIWQRMNKRVCLRPTDTGSMRPLIVSNCEVTILYVHPSEIKVGDILVFQLTSGPMIAHRVVHRCQVGARTYFWQQGDSATSLSCIPEEQVYGKIVQIRYANGTTICLNDSFFQMLSYFFARCRWHTWNWAEKVRRWFNYNRCPMYIGRCAVGFLTHSLHILLSSVWFLRVRLCKKYNNANARK